MLYTKSFLIIEYRFKTIRFDFSLYCRYNVECLQIVQDELRRFFEYKYMTKNLVYQMSYKAFYIYICQRIYIIIQDIL